MEHDLPADPAPPAVNVRRLRKVLGRSMVVLDEVDLRVDAGEVCGLVGPNGAGKSTIFRILLGLARASAGSVEIFGEPVGPGAAVLGVVGAMVDGPGFLPYLSGRRNLELVQRMNRAGISSADLATALASSGLGAALDRPYRTYSHGMRYRLGLASALMGRPRLLLLDEPTTGLDPSYSTEVEALIREQRSAGTTVILSSHDLGFVERVCTQVVFLVDGQVRGSDGVSAMVARFGSLLDAYGATAQASEAVSSSGAPG